MELSKFKNLDVVSAATHMANLAMFSWIVKHLDSTLLDYAHGHRISEPWGSSHAFCGQVELAGNHYLSDGGLEFVKLRSGSWSNRLVIGL